MEMDPINKSKIEQQAVLALLVVFAVVIYNSLKSVRGPARTRAASAPNAPSAVKGPVAPAGPQGARRAEKTGPATAAANQPAAQFIIPVTYTADDVRNPLAPLLPKAPAAVATEPEPAAASAAMVEPPAVSIQGMIWGGVQPQVIIGGQLYAVGDEISGARIVSIDRGGVMLESQGQVFHIPMSEM